MIVADLSDPSGWPPLWMTTTMAPMTVKTNSTSLVVLWQLNYSHQFKSVDTINKGATMNDTNKQPCMRELAPAALDVNSDLEQFENAYSQRRSTSISASQVCNLQNESNDPRTRVEPERSYGGYNWLYCRCLQILSLTFSATSIRKDRQATSDPRRITMKVNAKRGKDRYKKRSWPNGNETMNLWIRVPPSKWFHQCIFDLRMNMTATASLTAYCLVWNVKSNLRRPE